MAYGVKLVNLNDNIDYFFDSGENFTNLREYLVSNNMPAVNLSADKPRTRKIKTIVHEGYSYSDDPYLSSLYVERFDTVVTGNETLTILPSNTGTDEINFSTIGVTVIGDPVDPEDPVDPVDPKNVDVGLSIVKTDLPNELLFFDLYINGALVPMVDYGGGYSEVDPVTVDYSNEFTIEFRCKPGSDYTFKDTIELRLYYDPIGGGSVFSDMLVIGDSAIAIVDLSNKEYVPPGISIDVEVFSYQIMPQPTVTSFPFINIYDVELDQLELLNTYRFTELVYSVDNIVEKDSDLSNYIVNLIKFPFSVAGGDPTNILIGDTLTTFTGDFIDNNLYEVDLGTISIPMTIQGSVSFSNVTIECYVPYMQKFLLDPDEVLGKVLQFKMIVNLLTGLVTVNVLNTFTNSIIHSDNVLVGESIPNAIGGGVDTSTDTILNTTTDRVYIEVKTLRPNNSTVTDQLLNVTGFIQVDNMLINSVATIEEQDEIRKLLRQGVFINE